jgi:hypothetical protein
MLNVITYGPRETDNKNQIITITDKCNNCKKAQKSFGKLRKTNHGNKMITLTVIKLCSFHCVKRKRDKHQ